MNALRARLRSFTARVVRSEDGASAVEYGLLVSLIALGIILALTALGGNLATLFNNIAGSL